MAAESGRSFAGRLLAVKKEDAPIRRTRPVRFRPAGLKRSSNHVWSHSTTYARQHVARGRCFLRCERRSIAIGEPGLAACGLR